MIVKEKIEKNMIVSLLKMYFIVNLICNINKNKKRVGIYILGFDILQMINVIKKILNIYLNIEY